MKPIPLSSPDGTIYAYACGHCHNVCQNGTVMGVAKPGRFADGSKRMADACCLCRGCQSEIGNSTFSSMCDPCRDAEDKRMEAVAAGIRESMAKIAVVNATRWKDESAAGTLRTLMEDISEDAYCAGWMMGLAESLWRFVLRGEAVRYGQLDINPEELANLRQLGESAGGWWTYHDDPESGELGRHFIPTEQWARLYAVSPYNDDREVTP